MSTPGSANDDRLFPVKAWTAFMIATNEIASRHRVDLDTTIKTLAEAGRDMSAKYKETSEGGLAANLVLC
jgi:L-serine dehydratase